MKTLYKLVFLGLLFAFSSCQEELVYKPFESSERGMPRYLANVEETFYSGSVLSPTTTISNIFSKPSYDNNGRLITSYNNFWGYDANFIYLYSEDEIELIANRQSGEVTRWKYILQNNLITSCCKTSTKNNYIITYEFYYNSSNSLVKIIMYDEEHDRHYETRFIWENGNIASVEEQNAYDYTCKYDFKYNHSYTCVTRIPFFLVSCGDILGLGGMDAILAMQNYFGTSISKNLPEEFYYNNDILSRVFDYEINSDGSLYKMIQISSDRKKTYRTYTFKWS